MKKAFSLIELSIVILIIGILIAGVTQGSRLVGQMRLASARALTQSSPVNSIKDLAVWIEGTSEKSFDLSKQEDGLEVDNWYDINPQTTSKINFTQTTAGQYPRYSNSGLNNLPSLQFDGSGTFLYNTTAKYNEITDKNQITIFAVSKTSVASNVFMIIKSGDDAVRISSHFPVDGSSFIYDFGTCCTTADSRLIGTYLSSYLNRANIIVWQKKPTTGIVRINGSQILNSGMSGSFSDSDLGSTINFYIGNGSPGYFYLNGFIGEFIVFRRSLKADEITDVERYLSKKWDIKI